MAPVTAKPPPPRWCRMLDAAIVAVSLLAVFAFLAAVASDVRLHFGSPGPTTLWENQSLDAALRLVRGEPLYANWNQGPFRFAIYGPAYYAALAFLAQVTSAGPMELISLGRAFGIASLAAGVVGVGWFAFAGSRRWWCAILATGCVCLLTPTAMRFIASARPDISAAALSVFALLFGLDKRRWTAYACAVLLVAALMTKITSLPAALAVAVALWPDRRRRLRVIAISALSLFLLACVFLLLTSQAWFARHLAVAAFAPGSLHYLEFMLLRERWEIEVHALVVIPALLLLTARRLPRPAAPYDAWWRAAAVYFLLSLGGALASGLHRGSDRNYLIEPALAVGMVIGLWGARAADARGMGTWALTRGIALAAVFNPMLMSLPARFNRSDANSRALLEITPYTPESFRWASTLPQPLLCLDPWLSYCADVPNELNDPITYVCYFTVAGREDTMASRAASGAYAAIVTRGPIEDEGGMVYDDIPSLWPGLRDVIRARYSLLEAHPPWWVYVPGPDATQPERKP